MSRDEKRQPPASTIGSQRLVSRPEVRAGALKVLKDALYGLYLDASAPTLARIAEVVGKDDDLPGAPSSHTIGRILSEATYPQKPRDVQAVAGALADLAGLGSDGVAAQQARLWQLWIAAGEDPEPGFVMAGPDDPRGHFTARSQGYQARVHGGDRFRGRQAARDAVTGWLQQDLPPGRPLVLTGQPGAGKSAVLARVVLYLEKTTKVLGVAVHARGITYDMLIESVAAAAGVDGSVPAGHLYNILKTDPGVPSRLVVAVDALDEAAEGQVRQIASLLADLARLPRLRVVVATRPLTAGDRYRPDTLLRQLGVIGPHSDNLVDLDTAGYLDPAGLRQFILAILTDDRSGRPSPYQAQPEVAARLAEVIARRASSNHQQPGSNYLVTALATTSLADQDEVLDPAAPGFDPAQIPATVGEAITKYTDRLGDRKDEVMGLLTALAYAHGIGVDQERWIGFAVALDPAPITSAGTGVPYRPFVTALKTLLGSPAVDYLLHTTTGDGTVHYRLFHQALIDYLLAEQHESGRYCRDQERITHTLLPATAGYRTTTGTVAITSATVRDWSHIDDYTCQYLPDHAAAGRIIELLMADPGFLLACPPGRILPHRHALSGREPVAAAAALEAAATSDWTGWNDDQRAWWLHVWARKTRATTVADALTTGHPTWPWHVHTAIWSGATHRTLAGHTSGVSAVAVWTGTDGRARIVSACDDGSVWVWDADTGTRLHELTGHTSGVSAVAVWTGTDGRARIVSACDDGSVWVWDADTGTRLHELTGHTSGVSAVAGWTGTDGRARIVSAGRDRSVWVWDADTGTRLHELTGHTSWVSAVAGWTATDGRARIVSAIYDDAVGVWDADTGTRLHELTGHTSGVSAVAGWTGTDGRARIVSACDDGSVWVWDADTGTKLHELTGHTLRVHTVAGWTGPDGRARVVSAGRDRSVWVWDADTGTRLHELTGHTRGVSAVAVWTGPDGRTRIVSASDDETVRVWDADPGTGLHELTGLTGHTRGVSAVAVWTGPDDRARVVSAGDDETVWVWDADTGTRLHELTGHTRGVSAVAVWTGPDSRTRIVSASQGGSVWVWDADTGTRLHELTGHIRWAYTVAGWTGTDGRTRIVSAIYDNTVGVWDADTGTRLQVLTGHTSGVSAVAGWTGTDGRAWVVSACDDGSVWVWDADTSTRLQVLTGHTSWVSAVAGWTGTDGRTRVVSAGRGGSVWVWDADTGTKLHELTGHTSGVSAVAGWTATDGRAWVVSGSDDGSVWVWDADTGTKLHELTGHTSWVSAVAGWTATDGRARVVSGSDDRSVMVWAMASRAEE